MPKGGTPTKGSTVPKYSIRVCLIWLVPLISVLCGFTLVLPFLLAGCLTPIEVPQIRQRLCGSRSRKLLPCLKAPPLLRLVVLWLLQVWWLVLWRAESGMSDSGPGGTLDASTSSSGALSWTPQTLSIVLPCAGEGEYAFKTVQSVFESTPQEYLKEIVVVDDGSSPPLGDSYLKSEVREQYRVVLIRHDTTVGLIGAKKDGGMAATGDIIVFFDCHVAPQPGWHKSFFQLIGENYRRIVVPVITNLDVGSWRQQWNSGKAAKCYLTWDADFKWYESDDPWVPVLSGGLLGISQRWWNETGGYDERMSGWGGENLDQSLRTWLCGGEIMLAKDSFVAHMWRNPNDPRTVAKYHVKPGAAVANRMRAAVAWYGEFTEKLDQFPGLQAGRTLDDGTPWYGDVSNIMEVRDRLQCRSFAWFMKRFKNVYEDGGLIPRETFAIAHVASSKCLTYTGQAGTSASGKGTAVLRPCNADDDRQRWHGANRDTSQITKSCCSGLRAWNTDQCITGGDGQNGIKTTVCDVSGRTLQQAWELNPQGQLIHVPPAGFMKGSSCLEVDQDQATVRETPGCHVGDSPASWRRDAVAEPIESRIYNKALAVDNPPE